MHESPAPIDGLDSATVACPDCDLLQRLPPLPRRGKASCVRCACPLAARPAAPAELPLALTIAAVIVFVIANAWPMMDLSAVGRFSSTTIAGGAYEMWMNDEPIVGVLIAFCAIVAPGGYLLFMLALLLAARRPRPPHWTGELLRWVYHFQTWSMLEVMMLGILVALIKIAQLATVEAGIGMYAAGVLIALIPAIMVTFDARALWRRVAWVEGAAPSPANGVATAEASWR